MPKNRQYYRHHTQARLERYRQAVKLYQSGATVEETATSLSVNHKTVRLALELAGVRNRFRKDVNQDYFATIDTETKAYWLGFLAADGCVDDRGCLRLGLASRDAEHVRRFREHIGSTHLIREKPNTFGGMLTVIAVPSVKMVTDLARHGITPRKSLACVPWSGPDDLMRHWMRGIVDGDGWIVLPKGKTLLTIGLCGSKQCVEAFADFGATVGKGIARPSAADKIWKVQFYGWPAQQIIRVLYDGCSVALPRKLAKATRALQLPIPTWSAPPGRIRQSPRLVCPHVSRP